LKGNGSEGRRTRGGRKRQGVEPRGGIGSQVGLEAAVEYVYVSVWA